MRMFELSDGSLVTSKQVAERVGCRLNTAYLRLKKSNDVDEVYKPLQKQQQRDMSSSGTPKKKVWICLLYTSPSPRDRSLSRMPSSA